MGRGSGGRWSFEGGADHCCRALLALGVVAACVGVSIAALAASAVATTDRGASAGRLPPGTPLRALKSFTFTSAMQFAAGGQGFGTQVHGTFVRPSSQDCQVNATAGGLRYSSRAVLIGSRVWLDEGSGLRRSHRSKVDFLDQCPSDGSFWTALDIGAKPPGLIGQPDVVNGIPVQRFDVGSAQIAIGATPKSLGLPSGFHVQGFVISLADQGQWIAALSMDYAGTASACRTFARQQGGADISISTPCTLSASFQLADANRVDLTIPIPH
jgi:hypothetical protein